MTNYAFSVLPYHMVRQVAKYVCQSKSKLDMDDRSKKIPPLVALFHVCHDWRQATLPMMFGSGTIGISERYKPDNVYACYQGNIIEAIDQRYNAYMLKLFIDVDLCDATNGKTLSQLLASNVGSFVFPSLKHVSLCISHRQETQLECSDANSNIRSLVRHICQMLPVLESVKLIYMSIFISMDIYVNTHQHKSNLADELSETLSVISFANNTLLGSGTESSLLVTSLTLLSITWAANYKTLTNILYANSQSLQKLHISYCTFEGIEELVHCVNAKEEYMCYPQLLELTLRGIDFTSEHIIPPTGNVVVFPRLCKVDICFEYPFSDNVLFRGNRWTLESVELALSIEATMQMGLDGVFNKENMIALHDVVIFSKDEAASNASINSCSKSFFQGLLSSTHYLELQAQSFYYIMIRSIDCKTQHHNLKYLHLGCSNVSFENIVVLVQALPRLSYLKSPITSLGDKYSGMSLPKMLKFMQSTFNPLSKSFHTWSIHSLDTAFVDLVTTCIMLLLDQCPNFQTVVFFGFAYITPIKIHQQLMRISPRICRLYSRENEKVEFNILFAPNKAVIKMYR